MFTISHHLSGLPKSIIGVYWTTNTLVVYSYAIGFRGQRHLQYFDLGFIYPWDLYSTIQTIVAVSSNNSQSAEFIPILRASAVDAANNWVPHKNTERPSSITFNGTVTDQAYVVSPEVRRSSFAIVFACIIFASNWAFTVFVIYIALLGYYSKDRKLGEGILVLPITLILAIPALRALFIGNPPFGNAMSSFYTSRHCT